MRNRFVTLLATLQGLIAALVAVPQAEIDAALVALGAVDTGLDNTLPNDLKNLMQQECFRPLIPPSIQAAIGGYSQVTDLPFVFNSKLLKTVKSGLESVSRDALGAIAAGVIAGQVSSYNALIQQSGLAGVLDSLDYTYMCLTSICGHAGVTDCAGDARTLLNLKSDNTFDTSIFGTWNSNAPAVAQLNEVNDALDVKKGIIDAISF